MQQFARGLQHRWGQLWQLCAAQTPVIAQDQARDYCQRLLNGGLQMFVQPVVDLQSGHLVKPSSCVRYCSSWKSRPSQQRSTSPLRLEWLPSRLMARTLTL